MRKSLLRSKTTGILSVLLLITTSINCGGAANEAEKSSALDDILQRREVSTQHRAFDHFSKGDLYERSGNLEKAADEYRLALFYDPHSDELKRSLARVLYDLSQFEDALDVARKIENPQVDDRMLLAACYNNVGVIEKTIEIYEEIAKADSVPHSVIENLAQYYTFKKNESKVEKYYNWLIENGDNERLWRSEKAAAYVDMDKPDKAVKIYTDMIKTDSLDYGAYLGLAATKVYLNDIDGALEIYGDVAHKNWENAQMLSMILPAVVDLRDSELAKSISHRIAVLFPDDYMSQRRYAIMLFTLNDLDQSDSAFTAMLTQVSDDPLNYYYRGRIAQQKELYPLAESLFIEAISYNDTLTESWLNLAFVRGQMDEYDAAMATFDSTLNKIPVDSTRILFFTGTYLSGQEMFDQAITYYERVLNSEYDGFDARFNLAAAYERTGRFDDAEVLFLDMLGENENNPVVLNYLGYMYADRGIKLDKAKDYIEKALEIDPGNGAYLDSYAWVLYKKGKYEEALKYQQMALEADTEDAVLYDHMGDIYYALDKPDRAHDHWQKALELDPDNNNIKDKLNR